MRLFRLLASAALLILAACSTNNSTSPATTPSTLPPNPGAAPTLAADPQDAQQQIDNATASAQTIVAATQAQLGLQPAEAACLATRLDADGGLRDALGTDPAKSSRFADLATLAQDCVRTTTGAINFANGIAAQSTGLSAETLGCLRDGYAKLSQDDIANLVKAGLDPTQTDPDAKNKIDGIVDNCRVDRTKLAPPPSR